MRGTFACAWNIAVRTRGVFSHRAGFQKLACAERGLVRTASQLFSGKLGANRSTSTRSHIPTTSPAPENRAPIKPAAPATLHTNQYQPQQPQHQHQKPHTDHITGAGKPRANQASSPGNTTHQPAATAAPTPKATHQPHHQHQKPRAACINAFCTATGRRRTFP